LALSSCHCVTRLGAKHLDERSIRKRRAAADQGRMPARTLRTSFLALLATLAGSAFAAVPAGAGILVESAPGCESPDSAPVFAPWGDPASYFLAPDGGFEAGGAGWRLRGSSVVSANSPFAVSGPGSSALALPAGSSAVSPVVCVGLEHPTMRFFAKRTSGGLLPSLSVDVLVEDNLGLVSAVPAGIIGGSGSWRPGPPMVVLASLLPLLPGSHTPVAFRFTARGGSYLVDDVYVDPYAGH
jgi:hypothetical protein